MGHMRFTSKGISSIIATIILVVITLVAAGMAAGYFYGLFGSQTSTANVAVTAVDLQASTIGTGALTVSSTTTAPSSNYIELLNSGTSSATVKAVFLTWGGSTYTATLTGASSTPGTPLYVTFSGAGATPTAGEAFTGYALLGSGEQVIFSGTFQ